MTIPDGWRSSSEENVEINLNWAEQYLSLEQADMSYTVIPSFSQSPLFMGRNYTETLRVCGFFWLSFGNGRRWEGMAGQSTDGSALRRMSSFSLWARSIGCCIHTVSPKNGQSDPWDTFSESLECRNSTQCPANAIGMAVASAASVRRRTLFQAVPVGATAAGQ